MDSTNPYGASFHGPLDAGSTSSAAVVVPLVVELLGPRSVVDVGCGTGRWAAEFKRQGVGEVLGVDLGGLTESLWALEPTEFVRRDLSQPLRLGRQFDLAVCLEVAEHLPASNAGRLVGELVGLAPAVLFSAAIPHQGGTGHVNEQWPEYWAQHFLQNHYVPLDAIRPRIWGNPEVQFWYAQNLLLFVSEDVIERREDLRAVAAATRPDALSRVHPTLYLASAEAARRPWRSLAMRAVESTRHRLPSILVAPRRTGSTVIRPFLGRVRSEGYIRAEHPRE